MDPFDIKTWTLRSIGNNPGKITSGVLSNKSLEDKKECSALNKDNNRKSNIKR